MATQMAEEVSVQCQDNPYGFNAVMVFGDETYGMTLGCIPEMTGYNQYLTRSGNGFRSGVINADSWNDAQASHQMLPLNVAVTASAISAPMNAGNQLGGRRMDPPFTGVYNVRYGWGGNGSQFCERDEQREEEEKEEKNLRLKEKKKKAGNRKRKRSHHTCR